MSVYSTVLYPGDSLFLQRTDAAGVGLAPAVRVKRVGSADGLYWLRVGDQPRTLRRGGRGVVADVGGLGVVLRLMTDGRSGSAVPLRVEAPASVKITKIVARRAAG